MRTRRQRPTPSTRGGRVKGTPRVRRRRAITDPKKSADQIIKAFQTKARSNKATKARSTPTPKAPTKPTKKTLQTTMSPRPVRKRPDVRPTKLGGTTGGTSASIAAKNSANSAAGKAQVQKLKEAMKKKYASDRASKARSTGTPKAPDKARVARSRKALEQFVRGLRQKPGGTKPKPKSVPKGTKTGPAVKGKMSTRSKPTGRPFPKIDLTKPRTGPTPKPKTPRPTRPPTRRPSRRPTGGMDAIRSGRRPPTRRPRLFSASSRPTRPPTRRPSRKPRRGFQR